MPAPESVVAAAIAQIEQGFAVFALRADAKVPVTEHGFKNATMRPDWIRRQLEAPAAGNYGLVWPVDRSDRVVVFDLDDGGGADRPWRDRMLDLVAQHGSLPPTKITTIKNAETSRRIAVLLIATGLSLKTTSFHRNSSSIGGNVKAPSTNTWSSLLVAGLVRATRLEPGRTQREAHVAGLPRE